MPRVTLQLHNGRLPRYHGGAGGAGSLLFEKPAEAAAPRVLLHFARVVRQWRSMHRGEKA
jgi:hypothetical protein